MRILGLDPGLRHTGWGVVDSRDGHLRFVACGTVHPPGNGPMADRLKALHDGVCDVIREWQPDEAGVEETFLNKNPGTTLKLGHARGVVLLVPALFGLAVSEYAAKSVKQAVVGTGGAIALAVADRVLMLEHAIYSVISPEGCASILWRDSDKAPEAAEALKLTSQDLLKLGVIDQVISEPLGGAHRDPNAAIQSLGNAIESAIEDLVHVPGAELRKRRRGKFLDMGKKGLG